jgi:hypothetical protein
VQILIPSYLPYKEEKCSKCGHVFAEEKELAYLENRKIADNPLFTKRLFKFFPKYSELNYYFTGMFVNNLLWNQNQVDNLL